MNEQQRNEILRLIKKIRNQKEQSPNALRAVLWFSKNINKIDLIMNKKYVSPETLAAIIEDFYSSGHYEAAVFASYKLITQEIRKINTAQKKNFKLPHS